MQSRSKKSCNTLSWASLESIVQISCLGKSRIFSFGLPTKRIMSIESKDFINGKKSEYHNN